MVDLKIVNGIGAVIADRMLTKGIDTVEKLASANLKDLLEINGIGQSTAKKYIRLAKEHLQENKKEDLGDGATNLSNNPQGKNPKNKPKSIELKSNSPRNIPSYQKFERKNKSNLKQTFIAFKKVENKNKPTKIEKKSNKSQNPRKRISKTFFQLQTMQRIRYLHFKIKDLEEILKKEGNIVPSKLNHFYEYIKLLNVNYKTQSQIKIFKELDITPNFYDPKENREIQIWDLSFECCRVLWVLARIYDHISKEFEKENRLKKAIVAKIECSKIYKTAAHFSAACIRQEDKGTVLEGDYLEEKSEESRIFAQNLAAMKEENENNLGLAAQLYAGLSALTKRLSYLKNYEKFRENHYKAQYHYDMGKACHLKAKFLLKDSNDNFKNEKVENLQKKANYYFLKAEEIWESMLKNIKDLSSKEKDNIRINLSIVNEDIMENDVVSINDKKAIKIQDPYPFIIAPENLAPFLPRTTQYLTKFNPRDFDFRSYSIYKNMISDMIYDHDKLDYLKNKKSAIGRTLKELKILYENNDIDINMFIYLLEKYSLKLNSIQNEIDKYKESKKSIEASKEIKKPKYLVQKME